MMYNLDDEEMLDIVDEYAEEHDSFDNSYAESLRDALAEYDHLTDGQRRGLENIIYKFRMIDDD